MPEVEIERKFDIEDGAPLPGLGGVVAIGDAREHRLRAVYLDTRSFLLARHRITLRRREGGADAGWHLKLPVASGRRVEIHEPLTDGVARLVVPEALRQQIADALGTVWREQHGADAVLLPAATLATHRIEVDLLEAHDDESDIAGPGPRLLAQLCDDTVVAEPSGQRWRELEVELVDGDDALLDRVETDFAAQGVRLADSPSKVARALGDRPERAARGLGPPRSASAAEVLRAHLADQVAEVLGLEAGVRADAPDAVHQARVATRRLRTALRTFRRLLRREATDPVRDELRWLAQALGGARDAEVMRDRVLGRVDALPAEQVAGPVRDRIVAAAEQRHGPAHSHAVAALDSPRYAALAATLLDLLAAPPWRERARRPAGRVLPALVHEAAARAERDWVAAQEATGEARVRLLHDTRKRAKAVRYAAEAVQGTFGDAAQSYAKAWKRVTQDLGEVQDAAVTQEWLLDLAAAAQETGEPTFTYGVLVAQETQAAQAGLASAEADLAAALGRALT